MPLYVLLEVPDDSVGQRFINDMTFEGASIESNDGSLYMPVKLLRVIRKLEPDE